jgi:hypothetical protein
MARSDGAGQAAAAAVASQIPGATIGVLQGQGHQAIDYDPDRFVRTVLEFDAPDAHSTSVSRATVYRVSADDPQG